MRVGEVLCHPIALVQGGPRRLCQVTGRRRGAGGSAGAYHGIRPADSILPASAANAGLSSMASSCGIRANALLKLAHSLGTETKIVGLARFRSSMKVASDSVKKGGLEQGPAFDPGALGACASGR